ncbi:MAG: hypothetical protein QM516_13560, partial [Limnohabitans sp.]|nr:hypothetical protein [Limnohabitans sp.]
MQRFAFITFAVAAVGASASVAAATDLTLTGTIGSPQGAPYDVFASDVALANQGTLVVGIRGADTVAPSAGSVEIFASTDEGWDRVARPSFAGLAAGDQLGESVAAYGDWFAAGAPRHDARGSDAGAVMLARRSGGAWSHAATLLPPAGAGAHFGASVAMTAERLAIGAPRAAGGGFVDVYVRVGDAWTFETRIANPTPSAANRFGESVALGTDAFGAPLLVIGDPADDAVLTDAGSARVYGFAAGAWSERAVLTASSTSDRVFFGQSVAVASGVVAVGAYAAAGGSAKAPVEEAGAVEVFVADGAAWSRVAVLTSPEAAAYGSFGWDIALESRVTASGVSWTMLVGEPGAPSESGDAQAGRVHCLRTSAPASW